APSNPLFRGEPCAWFLVTNKAFRLEHRVGGVASMPGFGFGQQGFCIFIALCLKVAEICGLRRINLSLLVPWHDRISRRIARNGP
uniref:hypothetical protein n=1 Tax=Sphingomonas sp. BE123 TaxID=2817842 RepID=UPI002869F759